MSANTTSTALDPHPTRDPALEMDTPIHHIGDLKKNNDEDAKVGLDGADHVEDVKTRVYGDYIDLPEGLPEEGSGLTIRALVVGCLLGTVVGASNIYLGLKTGFTFGASLFGAIFGFAILRLISLGGGRYFGPKENCTVQTAATAAGGLSTLFVAALPAMYQGRLLSPDGPSGDVGKIFALTIICAYYGVFFAVPLRKWFVLRQKLVFPTPFASAATIASLHSVGGAGTAMKKAKIMGYAFLGAILWNMFGFFVPGVYNMHIFSWMHMAGCGTCFDINKWGWVLVLTPAFFGAGALSGVHASASMMVGSITGWGIIGPLLISEGIAKGSYFGFPKTDPANNATPRYWLLFPGVTLMTVASFAELAYNWRPLYQGLRAAVTAAVAGVRRSDKTTVVAEMEGESIDPAPKHEQVPTIVWVGGLIASSILTIIVLATVFDVGVGEGILALFLAFILAFVGIQSAGTSDINPVGAIAKSSQFVFGGISRSQGKTTPGPSLNHARTVNLISGAVAGAAAHQAVDMVGDLKTGHLLRASPRTQFIAQAVGTGAGVFTAIGLFLLYNKAYPCIANPDLKCASFDLVSAIAWKVVAEVLTAKDAGIPTSSAWACLVAAIVSIVGVILSHKLPPRIRWIIPNMPAIGIAWILTSQYYSIAMLLSSCIMYFWNKRSPASYEVWCFALASGLIAGEGIGGLIQAFISILGGSSATLGTAWACPAIVKWGPSVIDACT
ncbi:hypothetical protein HDU89_007595 [Geranomyces variabilis]|nr:hypothetical protein HDU89_007595 [Geranomyces variabilis]